MFQHCCASISNYPWRENIPTWRFTVVITITRYTSITTISSFSVFFFFWTYRVPLRRDRVVDLSWWRVEQAWGRTRLESLRGWDSLRPTESGRCTESWDPCYDLPLGWASIARLWAPLAFTYWNTVSYSCAHMIQVMISSYSVLPVLLPSATSLKWNPCCIWVRSHGLVGVYGEFAISRMRFRHCWCVSMLYVVL